MIEPLKFVNHRIEDYAMKVTFNPVSGTGTIVYNLTLIPEESMNQALDIFRATCNAGISPSSLFKTLVPGERIDDFIIPDRYSGMLTLCSTTLDGLLTNRGIPMTPIGGGVVEIVDNEPRRFTHLIQYKYTTIDPLEVLISQEITSVVEVMKHGNGSLLGNIRQCHMESELEVERILEEISDSYFTGILDVGLPNTPCLGVALDPQYMGVAALGGTNWIAVLKEKGIDIKMQGMKGVIDISEMTDIRDI